MKVTVIIPAFNEESRIEKVIIPTLENQIVSNIIVIDDGSEDLTGSIVSKYDVTLIKMPYNMGKTKAIKEGINYCINNSDIILLLDADLVGLKPGHITNLILPLYDENIDMTIGIFKSGRYLTDLAQNITPSLSGQRAFKSYIGVEIINMDATGYGFEVKLSKLIKKCSIRVENVFLNNVTHITKEEKVGIAKGVIWRAKMYKDIIKHWIN